MAAKKEVAAFDPVAALLGAFGTNQRINLYLLEHLPEAAWRVKGPGGKGRDAASIVAHLHNVRVMWLKAAGGKLPAKLEGEAFGKAEAAAALAESYGALQELVGGSLRGDGRIKGFKPDVASFVGYLIAHDPHHRGQILMLARLVGHPISQSAMFGMWEWGTR